MIKSHLLESAYVFLINMGVGAMIVAVEFLLGNTGKLITSWPYATVVAIVSLIFGLLVEIAALRKLEAMWRRNPQ